MELKKKIDWSRYTKAELIEVIEHIRGPADYISPWILHDVLFEIDKRKVQKCREEMERYAKEAHDARAQAIELHGGDLKNPKVLSKIAGLMKRAAEADRAYLKASEKWDRLVGLDRARNEGA